MTVVTRLFPLWAILLSVLAYTWPSPFAALRPAIVPLLGLVMFGMGMTLTPGSFTEALRRPAAIGLGILLQYGIMPLTAWVVSGLLGLPTMVAVGVILVGTSPGGTASNVICYLARGDLALSITLTTASTLLAIVAMPLLTLAYAGRMVPVPAVEMLWDVLRIVLVPVLLGVAVNGMLGRRLRPLKRGFPIVSVAAIVLIIAVVVALNRDSLAGVAPAVVAAVLLHNGLGLAAGYTGARGLGFDRRAARTLAIEVGMQNSGLAVALAVKHFAPAAALPGALFSVWHNVSGSLLASWWAGRAPRAEAG